MIKYFGLKGDIRVISARTWARARTKRKSFPQSKLDSKINAPFVLKKHGDLYFLFHENVVHIILFNFLKI